MFTPGEGDIFGNERAARFGGFVKRGRGCGGLYSGDLRRGNRAEG